MLWQLLQRQSGVNIFSSALLFRTWLPTHLTNNLGAGMEIERMAANRLSDFFISFIHQSNACLSTKFTQLQMATFEDLLTNRRHHDLNFLSVGPRPPAAPHPLPPLPRATRASHLYEIRIIARSHFAWAHRRAAASLMRWNEKRIMSLINHIVLNELHGNTIDWINGTFLCVPYI